MILVKVFTQMAETVMCTRAATILRLLGNKTIQFNTRCKKSEPGLRKQLNIDIKSTTKFNFYVITLRRGRTRVRVRVNNFFSKTTRPRDMLFFLKDTLSIEDEKLFKACKSVCSSVC